MVFKIGNKPWNKGVPWTDEERRKISISKRKNPTRYWLGRKRPKGEEAARWKGGDFKYWKPQVIAEANYTCQVCGLQDKEVMEVDHIIPVKVRPDLRNEKTNLMCLCANCHRRKTNRELREKIYANHS